MDSVQKASSSEGNVSSLIRREMQVLLVSRLTSLEVCLVALGGAWTEETVREKPTWLLSCILQLTFQTRGVISKTMSVIMRRQWRPVWMWLKGSRRCLQRK
jgi:hypothetical protein